MAICFEKKFLHWKIVNVIEKLEGHSKPIKVFILPKESSLFLHSNIEIFTRIFQISSSFDIQKVTVHKIELSQKSFKIIKNFDFPNWNKAKEKK